jgi:hypothetical protein
MSTMTVLDKRTTASSTVSSLMRQFLVWVDTRPRSYDETMDAWRSHCPRFTIWEDALGDGLVQVVSAGTTLSNAHVVLTRSGKALLNGA